MAEPLDPKWQQRKWQVAFETAAGYVGYLYEEIRSYKRQIMFFEQMGLRNMAYNSSCGEIITILKQQLREYQTELREVLGR
jgi:hypothetical protein